MKEFFLEIIRKFTVFKLFSTMHIGRRSSFIQLILKGGKHNIIETLSQNPYELLLHISQYRGYLKEQATEKSFMLLLRLRWVLYLRVKSLGQTEMLPFTLLLMIKFLRANA